jgi:hypothetical protein
LYEFFFWGIQIGDLKVISSHPSTRESTTAIFAFGIDWFYTQSFPSNSYDKLSEEFNYFALITTSLSLLVLTFLSWQWSRERNLKKLWK